MLNNKQVMRCPVCGHCTFEVGAYVLEKWMVDEKGEFISLLSHCFDVVRWPQIDDRWQCTKCGHKDKGLNFITEK